MAGHLDSESVFRVRLLTLGISDAQVTALHTNDVKTMAQLAYLCAIQPGSQVDDSPFFNALAPCLGLGSGADIPLGDKSRFRRAWFEASTVAFAAAKSAIDRTDSDAPRKMPLPERVARLNAQQKRLAGVAIEGSLQPSHALLDIVWAMREEDQLKYIPPESCTSRPQETLGIRKESFVKADSSGNLKSVEVDEPQMADLTTEYRVKLALTRRALAFDQIGLASFNVMESYHGFLYELIMREPLETHHSISVAQILRADKQLWVRLIDLTREGILPDAAGKKPIEEKLLEAKLDPHYNAILQPLPKANSSYQAAHDKVKPFVESVPYKQTPKGKGRGKGKGKPGGRAGKGGKGKGGKDKAKLPDELKGLRQATNRGNPYCWSANLKDGCPNAAWGQYCYKGLHGCMKCGSPEHGAATCNK